MRAFGGDGSADQAGASPNSRALDGRTPLHIATHHGNVDATEVVCAGANTTRGIPVILPGGGVQTIKSPLYLMEYLLRNKAVCGETATERQLDRLGAMRRSLLRVEALHAVSWLWVSDGPSVSHAAAEGTGRATPTTSTPLVSMLPILRRRAGRPRVLLAALFRSKRRRLKGMSYATLSR